MARWTFYRLKPKAGAGFHFGLRGLEQEESAPHCPSDTLFAALVATQAALDGGKGVRAFVTPFEEGAPPFLLTSAFPFAGALPLLPFPILSRHKLLRRREQHKRLKRVRYVSPTIFRHLLARELPDDALGPKSLLLQEGQVWITADEVAALPEVWGAPGKVPRSAGRDWRRWATSTAQGRAWLRRRRIWASRPVERVTVDRLTSTSSVYRTGRTTYAPGCGLWFGLLWPHGVDEALRARLEMLLDLLGDQGLGGERTVGYGHFTWEAADFPLDLPPARPDAPALTLARYLPRRDELPTALQGTDVAYRLVSVAGWLRAPGRPARRRRQVRLLAAGSVFHTVGPSPWGRLADVRPLDWKDHPIWRYGYACPVGLSPNPEEEVGHA